jgi:hypothetical protein
VDTGKTYYSTTIKHYVETEDTMDNMKRTTGKGNGFVQRSKHGGIYTWGNLERFPFGRVVGTDSQNAHSNLHETGFTTYGYTSYESLYGYVKPADGAKCAPTAMGMDYHVSDAAAVAMSADATIVGKKMTFNFAAAPDVSKGDILTVGEVSATCKLVGTYTVYSRSNTAIVVVEAPPADITGTGATGTKCNARREAGVYKTYSGAQIKSDGALSTYLSAAACTDIDTGRPTPFLDEAATTQATSNGGDLCLPMATATVPCQPTFREDTDVATAGTQGAVPTGAGTALYQPPKDVIVRVTDNDVIAEQAVSSVDGCRSTQLFQFAQSTSDSVGQQTAAVAGDGVFKKQWLTDYNCKSGDAGGLPGYPVEVAAGVNGEPANSFDGYCTDTNTDTPKTTKAACEAS